MDDTYDVIILGTGLTECILSGLLSVNGKKVLHLDRQDFYGGDCASLPLDQAWKYFGEAGSAPASLGKPREYNIDLVPKFLMANGTLVKMLLHTDVTRYLEFKSIEGSYVLKDKSIAKVPATEKEALSSSLMGLFEKKRFKDFLTFVTDYEIGNPKTHDGVAPDLPTAAMMKKYKLDDGTIDVVGHALALYTDESWLKEPAKNTIDRVALYVDSLRSYGKSPYLYPIYGLGDLPQSFARLSAVYGGTYMLNTPIEGLSFDEKGHVNGVKSGGKTARCKLVIGDPSYFTDRVTKIGDVVRSIAILDHPVDGTDKSESVQIILPAAQVKRKNDIYVSVVSFAHNVAPKGKYLAIVSTTVETNEPKAELEPGFRFLGQTLHRFYKVYPLYAPKNDWKKEGIHISKSYDATSHFDSMAEDVKRMYQNITGEADVSYILVPKKKEGEQ